MASTSGTINTVTVTRDQIILDALQDLRVIDQSVTTGTLNANDVSVCAVKLNMVLKRWGVKALFLWLRDVIQVPLVTNQYRYTIGPGGDVNTYRPLRMLDTSYVRQTCGTNTPTDVPLTLMSRKEYETMGNKGTIGTPNSFYYDPQMAPGPLTAYDPASSKGVLYIWTAPQDATRTAFMDCHRPIQDITSAGQSFDIPLEWYEALTRGLGAAVADKYEIPEDRIRRIKQEAKEMFEELSDWGAQEQAPITFRPDYQFWAYGNR